MMNRHTGKKVNRSMRRMMSLLLAALMLGGSAFADNTSDKAMQELYGDDWRAVAALQPGDSYISGETMYVCHEETYVDWKRVRSANDLDPASWGGKEALLLMTDLTGEDLFVGNDYATVLREVGGVDDQVLLNASSPSDTRRVISGVTRDTAGSNTAEYVDELVYPELNAFVESSTGGYPYPDTFRTLGTMNAPYIQYAGLDSDNGNQRKFKIILPKDDGSISSVALSHANQWQWESVSDWETYFIEPKAVKECKGYTFHFSGGTFRIFANIPAEEDLLLRASNGQLFGRDYHNLEDMPSSDLVLFVGHKTVGKRIEAISLALEDAEQNPEALENVYGGAIEFYRWEKITSSSQLPTGNDTYRALLVWDNKYFLQGDDFRRKSGGTSMALYVNEEDTTNGAAPGNVAEVQEIDLDQNEFYTMGGLGTPYIKFSYKDTDSDNDYCPYYTFRLAGTDDRPSEKWLCDGDNILDVCLGEVAKERYGGMDVGIIVGQEGDSDNDAAPGKTKLFFNEGGGGKDTGFQHSGNVFYAESDGGGWGYGEFTLYIGKPVVYPAIRQNYVVGEDQFVHISQNGAMLKNVTVTVAKGGVLSVESWLMNNGRIVADGGTVIVQTASNPLGDEMADDTEDSVMMPFADIHPSVSGTLELKNGAELIVMDGARAAFSNITATTGSSIFNNGILMAETVSLRDSTMENGDYYDGISKTYQDGQMFFGYDFREMTTFRNSSLGKIIGQLTSRLPADIPSIVQERNSAIRNEGEIRYSTYHSYMDDPNVKRLGLESMMHVRGETSRFMLGQ